MWYTKSTQEIIKGTGTFNINFISHKISSNWEWVILKSWVLLWIILGALSTLTGQIQIPIIWLIICLTYHQIHHWWYWQNNDMHTFGRPYIYIKPVLKGPHCCQWKIALTTNVLSFAYNVVCDSALMVQLHNSPKSSISTVHQQHPSCRSILLHSHACAFQALMKKTQRNSLAPDPFQALPPSLESSPAYCERMYFLRKHLTSQLFQLNAKYTGIDHHLLLFNFPSLFH